MVVSITFRPKLLLIMAGGCSAVSVAAMWMQIALADIEKMGSRSVNIARKGRVTEMRQIMNKQIAEKIIDTIGILGAVIFCPIWIPIVAAMAVARIILFAWYYYFGNNQ